MAANIETDVQVSRHLTNDGSSVDEITFASNPGRVEIANYSTTATIYFRVDGTDPETPFDDCYRVPPGWAREAALDVYDRIRLVATASCDYSVTAA